MKKLLLTFLFVLPSLAQEIAPKKSREQLIEALMNASDAETLAAASAEALAADLPQQMITEAKFLLLVNEDDTAGLAALAPALKAQLPTFDPDHSMIFAAKEDFESIFHYTLALDALQKKDQPTFKKHITEAFWLSPNHAAQYAPHINQLRLQQTIENLTLDLSRTFVNQKKPDQKISLKELIGESPALLIQFWSPWIQASIDHMDQFEATAKALEKHQIPSASFLLSSIADSHDDAKKFVTENEAQLPGSWLIDTEQSSLAIALRISSFPAAVIINPQGKVLFHGPFQNPSLWKQLAQINPAIKRP